MQLTIPMNAMKIAEKIVGLEVIKIDNENTLKAAMENIKTQKLWQKEFDDFIEPQRQELRKPLDLFLKDIKSIRDSGNDWEYQQKQEIGRYIKSKAELEENVKVKTEFVKAQTKYKPIAKMVDKIMFIEAALTSGNIGSINSIFEINQSKLNTFCKDNEIDGVKKLFPGLEVRMEIDITTR
jgi:hypothetical protein